VLDVIWDRVLGGAIRGLSQNYIQVSAAAEGRRPGELERIVYRPDLSPATAASM
jgi:hypothetical protein